jgi:hypothetical protein
VKDKHGIIDLEAPLATSAGRPTGEKATKATALEKMIAHRVQTSINKCLADVSENLLMRGTMIDKRWKVLLLKQE